MVYRAILAEWDFTVTPAHCHSTRRGEHERDYRNVKADQRARAITVVLCARVFHCKRWREISNGKSHIADADQVPSPAVNHPPS
jgi:hypothetical protein